MGLYVQFQRRAIESLRDHPEAIPTPPIADASKIHSSQGNKLYIAGVSNGIGTCSDVLDMDVLVLTDKPVRQHIKPEQLACAYTVLLRDLTEKEIVADDLARLGVARRCVELLSPTPQDAGLVVFEPTDRSSIYTAVI